MTRLRSTLRSAIARHPITAFLLITFAASWSLTALVSTSILFGLFALFGPALGALIVSRAEGSTGELRDRLAAWRQPPVWYLAAFGIPFAVATVAAVIHTLLTGSPLAIGAISAIEMVIFVLVVGEEIGWRGFLQPRLRARMGLVAASLATGVVWTAWHLPIHLQPGMAPLDFLVFGAWVVPFAVVIGFVGERTGYSIVVATVMHGAANIALPILLPGVDRTWTLLGTGALYALLAVGIALWAAHRPEASSTMRAERLAASPT